MAKVIKGRWKPGQSGNPAGKPKGTRNRMTRVALALLEKEANEIARAVINAAKNGDMQAARLVLERLVPPVKERPIQVELPDVSTPAGVSAAMAEILRAVGTGELLPGEGATLAAILERRRDALETDELSRRIAALEESLNGNHTPAD